MAKVFRYLRMVKVTTAVCRGFTQAPRGSCVADLRRARVSPHTSCYHLAWTCGFVNQSLPPITCGSDEPPSEPPFSRSYGVSLQSSLSYIHPYALALLCQLTSVGFSTKFDDQPVSRMGHSYELHVLPTEVDLSPHRPQLSLSTLGLD